MPRGAPAPKSYESISKKLEVLASATRLQLLHVLRTPRTLQDIRVEPSLVRVGENPERPLSRQGVARHVEQLLDAGLVKRISAADARQADTYVLNHERVFALVNEIRNLSKLRPVIASTEVDSPTMEQQEPDDLRLPARPRLLLAYGRDDGVGYTLSRAPGAKWRIGRSAACEIRLDYDPYVSAENSVVESGPKRFAIRDVAGSRNGTWVNWKRLPAGGVLDLSDGDLISVGQSLLVLQT